MNRFCVAMCVLASTFTQGCAFTTATLDVGLPVDAEMRGPLSSVSATDIHAGEMTDVRIDKERIGWKKNTYGANTADILTVQPIADILRTGIERTLEANGHSVNDSGLRIDSELSNFWLEFDINFWTVELIGNMEAVFILLTDTGQELYRNTYSGSYSEKTGSGGEKKWARVMSKTLAALLEDFAFDEELVEMLDSFTGEDQPEDGLLGSELDNVEPLKTQP